MGCLNDKETSEQVAARFRPFKTRHASPLDVKTYKIVFLGKSGVGKTSILMRYSQEVFHPTVDSTIGAVFSTKTIKTPDNKMMTIEMWDTAGTNQMNNITQQYLSSDPQKTQFFIFSLLTPLQDKNVSKQ